MTSKILLNIFQTKSDVAPGLRFGTAAMLICLLVILGYQLITPVKVRIERKVETSGEVLRKRLPTINSLIAFQAKLSLNKEQVTRLNDLSRKEKAQLKPVEGEITEIRKRFESDSKETERTMTLADLQRHATNISAPSKVKREIEVRFSIEAWRVLREEQRLVARQIFSGAKESGY